MPENLCEFEIFRKKWPIVFAVDTSGSMEGQHLTQLNIALQEISDMLESLANQNEVQLSIRLIEYNTTAHWLVGNLEFGMEYLDVYFSDAAGLTNTAEALRLVRDVMSCRYLGHRSLKPLVILITDGYSINPQETAEEIDKLKICTLGRHNKILRVAFAIGDEAIPELEMFASEIDDRSLVFKVDNLGHIQEADLLRVFITSFCFSYVHDHVLPYDDSQIPSISEDFEWEE
mgnify:CR=1 FL=1